MSAAGRPPSLTPSAVYRVVCNYFNFKLAFKDSVKPLPSYDDRNYFFRGESLSGEGSEFILKLCNSLYTTIGVAKGLNEAMLHLNSCGLPFSLSCPLRSKSGEHVIQLTASELTAGDSISVTQDSNATNGDSDIEEKYCVRVFTFLSGQECDKIEKKYLTTPLLYDIGVMVGRCDKELMDGFSSKVLESRRNPQWDLMEFLTMKELVKDIDDVSKRNVAELVIRLFEENVVSKIPSFKRGIIHGDCNGLNIIVNKNSTDSYHIVGLIDFGDCLRTCTIFELGICLAYIMTENMEPPTSSNVVEFVGPIIHGYHSILPLSENEFDSLYYLVLARCIQSAVNGEHAFKAEPWNLYILTTPNKAWQLVGMLLNMTKPEVDRIWKKYCLE